MQKNALNHILSHKGWNYQFILVEINQIWCLQHDNIFSITHIRLIIENMCGNVGQSTISWKCDLWCTKYSIESIYHTYCKQLMTRCLYDWCMICYDFFQMQTPADPGSYRGQKEGQSSEYAKKCRKFYFKSQGMKKGLF